MEKSRKPKIRFKGFSDDWEQREFSNITFSAGEKNKDNLPLESYSITNEYGFIPQDLKFENGGTMREADKRMYYIVSPNSFAYNPARINVGSIGYQNIEKKVIVSSLYEIFKTTEEVDDRLLWHWFKSPDFQKLILQLQEGGVRLYFYYDKLCMGKISLPSLEEQKKIGKLLDDVDHLITLHQRKLEKLMNVKKSMLEKMFPKQGSKVPEIRFNGFTDDWEQRELEEVAKYRNGKAHENCIDDNGKYIVVNSKFVSTDGGVKKFSNLQNEPLFKNEIAFVLSDVPNGRALARTFLIEKADKYTLNQRIAGITPLSGIYPYYLYILMNRHPYFLAFDDGAKQTNLSVSDVMEFESYYPIYDEQKKIGECFHSIDKLITLHQRKLEKLKNIKKSMLEKMFI